MKKSRLMWLFLVLTAAISAMVVVVFVSTTPSRIVKEGKIRDIEFYVWHNHETLSEMAQIEYGITEYFLNRPSVTILYFEDGEAIPFVGILDSVKIGVKYRIGYHEQRVHSGNIYWIDNYYRADNIEAIE